MSEDAFIQFAAHLSSEGHVKLCGCSNIRCSCTEKLALSNCMYLLSAYFDVRFKKKILVKVNMYANTTQFRGLQCSRSFAYFKYQYHQFVHCKRSS